MVGITRALGRRMATYLNKPRKVYERHDAASLKKYSQILEPGDVLLVDGNSRISTAIKYLTQSTWSHACIFVGPMASSPDTPTLIEADLTGGVIKVPLRKFEDFNLRICRAVGLTEAERVAVIHFVESRLGYQYDLKNIFDLMRFLIQTPAVPTRYRRKMITLGSGEPTKAICSTLIAQAFQSIQYPILPRRSEATQEDYDFIYEHRHFTHYVPRDFDISPYFKVVKPTLEIGFDFHSMHWKAEPIKEEDEPLMG